MKTKIVMQNNQAYISVDGALHYPLAYTTYFDECGEYDDFINSGYRMFFVNVSFTDLPINNRTGFTPFRVGVFEKEEPDYAFFDEMVRLILSKCPDALIFPRINISMPRKWIAANPEEAVETPNGGNREALWSEQFRKDGALLLQTLVGHIRSSDYADSIAGYMICGGTTQEWFPHDLYGSYSDKGLSCFKQWLKERLKITDLPMPLREDFEKAELTPAVSYYAQFCCEVGAKTAEYFAKEMKTIVNGEQVVGIFYGYTAFVGDFLWGHQGLRHIIDSPYIDFFSSPCCYDELRGLGVDWGDMIPVDSVKVHEKLSFIECDVRTFLTKNMQASRPGEYPDDIMLLTDENGRRTVWKGPESLSLSVSAIRKAFAHQITRGSGVWWFDMWGGWYHDDALMQEIAQMKTFADRILQKDTSKSPCAQTVVFVDERAYANLARCDGKNCTASAIRLAMGSTGIPFDLCMVEDAPNILHKYKAAVFTAVLPSEAGKKAMLLCEENKIPFVSSVMEKPFISTEELRAFLVSVGIHCYQDNRCVVYVGNGILAIHSPYAGEVIVRLPKQCNVKALAGCDLVVENTEELHLPMQQYDTFIFKIQ